MGTSHRLAAVAAVSHARHLYNQTKPEVTQTDMPHYSVNILFISATLCGVLVAVCAACWRRSPSNNKPEDIMENRGVYTVSNDTRLSQIQEPQPGPPPAYDTVVEDLSIINKDCHSLQEVITEPCPQCSSTSERCDSGLPTYEAAVLLKDTKL